MRKHADTLGENNHPLLVVLLKLSFCQYQHQCLGLEAHSNE